MIELRIRVPVERVPDAHHTLAEREAEEAFILSLLRQGDISAGRAAELLRIDRGRLSALMTERGISPFDETTTRQDLEREVAEAAAAG